MQNEILKPVLATDETAIPRYDIVNPDGSVAQQNVELRLKNEVMQQGTPYDEESVLPATLCEKLGLPNSATPANAFEAVLAKAGAKVSMNEPTSQDNIAAGYSTGAMWLRPYYTLTNMVYALEASSITPSACTVNKSGQTFTVAGNGDDKVISVSYTMPTNNGWLYAVVTPDSTASSATIVVGDKTVELTPGSASTVCVQFTGTALQVSATYSTANTASSGTIEIKNLTVLDNAATVVQCVDSEQDITVASIKAHCDANAPYSTYNVPSKLFQQTHDEVWEVIYDSNSYTNQEIISDATKSKFGLPSTATSDDALSLLSRFSNSLGSEYIWEKSKTVSSESVSDLTRTLIAERVQYNGSTTDTFYLGTGYTNKSGSKEYPYKLTGQTNFTTAPSNFDSIKNNFLGKYVCANNNSTSYQANSSTGVYYVPSDATMSYKSEYKNGNNYNRIYASKVTWYRNYNEVKTIYGYVNSDKNNAYPPSVSDGYTYTPLGQLGSSAKIISGMYSGTGTWGESGASSLTFDRLPDLIWIYAKENQSNKNVVALPGNYVSGNEAYTYTINPKLLSGKYMQGYSLGQSNNYNNYILYARVVNNTIYWYASYTQDTSQDVSYYQFNETSKNYYYLAFFS